MTDKIGVLLTNIGSPDSPTSQSVKVYLKKFLSDPRVIELPKILWQPILNTIVLPIRSKRSAKLYQQIWTDQGSPLILFSKNLVAKLQETLQLPVELGTHYGNPSIPSALEKLRQQKVTKILILPLFPQYSGTTTAATFDQVSQVFKKWRELPEIRTIHQYATNENYINALCKSIQSHSINHLLFSFHAIPEKCVKKGDPYFEQCNKTASLIAEKLQLTNTQWSISFQSRMGRIKWLSPYTDQILKELPKKGIKKIHVICPGFATDCLETLEEIAIRGKKQFKDAGGESFEYISALNDTDEHMDMLKNLIVSNITQWILT